jgi:hypothetical protein
MVKPENVSENGFSYLQCSVYQSYIYYKCNGCGKLFHSRNHDKRYIWDHVKTKHPELLLQHNLVHGKQKSEGIQDNLSMYEDNQEDVIGGDSNF